MLVQALVENGLSEKEAKLYLTVLEAGEATIAQLAKHSDLKRTTLYSLVENLEQRRILYVSKKDDVQYISAAPPRVLVQRFKQAAQIADDILPQLMDMAYASPHKPKLKFYDTEEQIKEMMKHITQLEPTVYAWANFAGIHKETAEYFVKLWTTRSNTESKEMHLLVSDAAENQQLFFNTSICRFIHYDDNIAGPQIFLFDNNKVAFASLEKDAVYGVILESECMHVMLRSVFLTVWNSLQLN